MNWPHQSPTPDNVSHTEYQLLKEISDVASQVAEAIQKFQRQGTDVNN